MRITDEFISTVSENFIVCRGAQLVLNLTRQLRQSPNITRKKNEITYQRNCNFSGRIID
jgi:hypothetical protein